MKVRTIRASDRFYNILTRKKTDLLNRGIIMSDPNITSIIAEEYESLLTRNTLPIEISKKKNKHGDLIFKL